VKGHIIIAAGLAAAISLSLSSQASAKPPGLSYMFQSLRMSAEDCTVQAFQYLRTKVPGNLRKRGDAVTSADGDFSVAVHCRGTGHGGSVATVIVAHRSSSRKARDLASAISSTIMKKLF